MTAYFIRICIHSVCQRNTIGNTYCCILFSDLYSMAEELITNVGQEEHVAYDNNCNLRKTDISVEEDSDVSLREILDTAFTSTVDHQDNVAFERCEYDIYPSLDIYRHLPCIFN